MRWKFMKIFACPMLYLVISNLKFLFLFLWSSQHVHKNILVFKVYSIYGEFCNTENGYTISIIIYLLRFILQFILVPVQLLIYLYIFSPLIFLIFCDCVWKFVTIFFPFLSVVSLRKNLRQSRHNKNAFTRLKKAEKGRCTLEKWQWYRSAKRDK